MAKKKKIQYHEPQMSFNPGLQKYDVDLPLKTKTNKELTNTKDGIKRLYFFYLIEFVVFIIVLLYLIWLFALNK